MPLAATLTEYMGGLELAQRCQVVDMNADTCSCGDSHAHNMPCKHMFMAVEARASPCLPPSLLQQPHLMVNTHVTGGTLPTPQQIPDAELHAEVEALAQELRLEAAGQLVAGEADVEEEEEPMAPVEPVGEEAWDEQGLAEGAAAAATPITATMQTSTSDAINAVIVRDQLGVMRNATYTLVITLAS